jgi:hypothetical protein
VQELRRRKAVGARSRARVASVREVPVSSQQGNPSKNLVCTPWSNECETNCSDHSLAHCLPVMNVFPDRTGGAAPPVIQGSYHV